MSFANTLKERLKYNLLKGFKGKLDLSTNVYRSIIQGQINLTRKAREAISRAYLAEIVKLEKTKEMLEKKRKDKISSVIKQLERRGYVVLTSIQARRLEEEIKLMQEEIKQLRRQLRQKEKKEKGEKEAKKRARKRVSK
jgi:glutamine amidotransferase-like uncharacterized protein